jgi:threonine/homoserine/homoserine lactone efflux protein
MELFEFIITVVLITVSGALAPGPLFFATISNAKKTGPSSGLIFSISHTVVEFSLIILLAFGLITIASEPIVRIIIGITGGIVLIFFGAIQIKKIIYNKTKDLTHTKRTNRRLFFIGLAFTGFNPYFIIWWLTVGAQLILIALEFGALLGVIFMYICHVWMDYVWLICISHFAKKGLDIIGLKWYRPLMILFGIILIYFGFNFLIGALIF